MTTSQICDFFPAFPVRPNSVLAELVSKIIVHKSEKSIRFIVHISKTLIDALKLEVPAIQAPSQNFKIKDPHIRIHMHT